MEDFTSKGLHDLKAGIIRTPLPPLQTFLDDPLRVLRTIRFAANLNFVVADEIFEAVTNPKIAVSLFIMYLIPLLDCFSGKSQSRTSWD